MHFLWKKKPLREAPQRIRGFYPEKKAPAGGPTTDKGFLYIKKIQERHFSRKKSPCGKPHNGYGIFIHKIQDPKSQNQKNPKK